VTLLLVSQRLTYDTKVEKFCFNVQGDSYGFINILTSGRFRSQKALNNKILSHTSKIDKNYHIGFFTIVNAILR
jgi:hypothetical protein